MVDIKKELLEVLATGSPVEVKLAAEQLNDILVKEMPPRMPEVKGDLIETYQAGDYTVRIFSNHSKFHTKTVTNPAAKLIHDRGQGIVTQPYFASRINNMPAGDVAIEGRVYTNSATLLIQHKNGSATTRKVTYKSNWSKAKDIKDLLAFGIITKEDAEQRLATLQSESYTYRDCRCNESISRKQFIESLPQPVQPLAAEIVFHLEVEALPPFAR